MKLSNIIKIIIFFQKVFIKKQKNWLLKQKVK